MPMTEKARFESIWEEYRLPVLAYCLRRLPQADAEDVCAEIFLVLWRRLDDVPPPPRTLLYLYGIAGKVLSNHLRSWRRRSRLDERARSLGVTPADDPGVLIVQSSEDERVTTAVRKLSPRAREIVMLYAWEDLSRKEIAEVLGMTKAAVDQTIHRSYRRLERVLEPVPGMRTTNSPPLADEGGT
jgi:RNA polymerase sigma-70 factor (ECF subfamily)